MRFNPKSQAFEQEPAPPAVTDENSRVHHEYFVGEERADSRWPWLCRVYAKNGAANEQAGLSDSYESAKKAALAYATMTKRALEDK